MVCGVAAARADGAELRHTNTAKTRTAKKRFTCISPREDSPAKTIEAHGKKVRTRKIREAVDEGVVSRNGTNNRPRRCFPADVQPPKRDSNMRITAFCRAMICACHTSTTDMMLMVKMQKARTTPVCVSEAGNFNMRRNHSMGTLLLPKGFEAVPLRHLGWVNSVEAILSPKIAQFQYVYSLISLGFLLISTRHFPSQ